MRQMWDDPVETTQGKIVQYNVLGVMSGHKVDPVEVLWHQTMYHYQVNLKENTIFIQ